VQQLYYMSDLSVVGLALRASTISPSQLAIRIKVIFSYLVGRERR
jgi:hypothetical protein